MTINKHSHPNQTKHIYITYVYVHTNPTVKMINIDLEILETDISVKTTKNQNIMMTKHSSFIRKQTKKKLHIRN